MLNKSKLLNFYIIITARTSSSRLPKKCLKFINKKRIIEIVIDRAKKIGYPIILATSKDKNDDILCKIAKKKILVFLKVQKKMF